MAKKAKVPLNVLVVEGTRAAIRELADKLECSQGTVVDRAIVLLAASDNVARGLQGITLPSPEPVTKGGQLDAYGPELSSGRGKATIEQPAARELSVELEGRDEQVG